MPPRFLLLCIGNTLRSDDGAAHALGRLLAQHDIPDLRILSSHQILPEHALDAAEAGTVVIADASLEVEAVRLEHLPAADADAHAPRPPAIDAHAMLPRDLAALCALMGGTGTSFHLLHIPAHDFTHGEQLSQDVAARVRDAAELLIRFFAASGAHARAWHP